MKFDFSEILYGNNGEPFPMGWATDDAKDLRPLTMAAAIRRAVQRQPQPDPTLNVQQFLLGKLVFENPSEVNISPEQVVVIKQCLSNQWTPEVSGPILILIDSASAAKAPPARRNG